MTNHLNDTEIQEYAMQPGDNNLSIEHPHFDQCTVCRQKLQQYRMLLTALDQYDTPHPDFNLANRVIRRLPAARPALSPVLSIVFIGFSVFSVLGLCYYFFSMAVIVPVAIALLASGSIAILIYMLLLQWRQFCRTLQVIKQSNMQL